MKNPNLKNNTADLFKSNTGQYKWEICNLFIKTGKEQYLLDTTNRNVWVCDVKCAKMFGKPWKPDKWKLVDKEIYFTPHWIVQEKKNRH